MEKGDARGRHRRCGVPDVHRPLGRVEIREVFALDIG